MSTQIRPSTFIGRLPHLVALTRLNRPIGIFLLMWPMLWALWFASAGRPDPLVLIVFVLGTVLTRSAGCAINDFADRHLDGQVRRTRTRPLATGALHARDALVSAAVLMGAAFLLVLLTNSLTVQLSVIALLLATLYPFTKRFTHWPQLFLGAAFAFAIPMVFAAQTGAVPGLAWWLFSAALVWALAYDTLYAMTDREDDLMAGIKSTAILFGRADLAIVGLCQAIVLTLLYVAGTQTDRGSVYHLGLAIAAALAMRQLWRCRTRHPQRCFEAFLNNHWLGMAVFAGLALDYLIHPGLSA